MFQKKTTIVIGAGASKEVGLPIGNELKNNIKENLNIVFDRYASEPKSGSYEIYSAIKSLARERQESNINEYIQACWKIRDGMPQAISIDNFIDVHNDNEKIELCGKLAIAESILKAERSSSLFIDRGNIYNKMNFARVEHTWYNSFFQLITENCRKDSLESRLSSITLIIFNYDRCIEHYLYHSFQNYYSISEERAKELVNLIEIYHPYGSLGNLLSLDSRGIDFGANEDASVLKEIHPKIKTFTEGTDPTSSEIQNIRKAVANCEILLFLGFSYQKQNLRLIKPTEQSSVSSSQAICFGTSLGLSVSSEKKIVDELSTFCNLSKENILLSPLECSKLFYEHWRDLSWD